MTSTDNAIRHIRISIRGNEVEEPSVSELGLFIYDFATVYELGRLATDPHYKSFRFTRFALYRNGRPLKREDQLNSERTSQESPLELISTIALIGGAAAVVSGAIWTITQTFEKIYNLPLNRRKLELEVKKLEREDAQAQRGQSLVIGPEEAMYILEEREALPYVDTVARRLEHSSIQVRELDVEVVNPSEGDAGRRRLMRSLKS